MSELARELAVRGGMGATRSAIRAVLTKETLRQFQRLVLKYLGKKITQKALISKTLPIVGGVIGGGWNYMEMNAVGNRVYAYFAEQPIGTSDDGAPVPEPVA